MRRVESKNCSRGGENRKVLIDKSFPWETFRSKLKSLYSKKPKWDVILLLKVLLIKFVFDISWNNFSMGISFF
ncbi:ORF1 in transposon ISC1212 [Saccharolobus solfataricus]|uniref:ORF1 in transposon ISC1212 n=1 Tax=Saccharolobus solfataricus TaxID=2287 RepID=A0A157T245_SACSO|nr:ORF1 in transposon ISC1212 [Saccharolobus solfataricus]